MFFLALFLAFFLYLPGLHGPFIFDDLPNLSPMGFFGGVVDFPSVLYFVFGNESGPLGRPLSMLSFLLNDQFWPSEPYAFKYTNLLFHLLNGCLIFKLLMQISAKVGVDERSYRWLSLAATTIWLIHPFNASTVLFVVQRMTILSSMMILLGLNIYIHSRVIGVQSQLRLFKFLFLMSIVGILGLLFKETAVLLIIYVAALEFTLFKKQCGWGLFRILLAVACVLLAIMIFWMGAINSDATWQNRGFTPVERVLTQTRVLWDYFFHIVIPRTSGSGLLHDDYQVSRGLFDPAITFLALISCVGMIVLGIVYRKKALLLSMCIFWFFGGHCLESTVFPLENYFEHRNYLPMILIIWGAVIGVYNIPIKKVFKFVFAPAYGALLVFILISTVQVWSSEPLLIRMWADEHPESPRAQQLRARAYLFEGDTKAATTAIQSALQDNPTSHHLMLQSILLKCRDGLEVKLSEYADEFKFGPKNNGIYDGLEKIRGVVLTGQCTSISVDELIELNGYFVSNNHYYKGTSKAFLYREIAVLYLNKGKFSAAIEALDDAYANDPHNIIFPLTQAYWLHGEGLQDDAQRYMDIASETKPRSYFQKYQYRKLYEEAKLEILDQQNTSNNF